MKTVDELRADNLGVFLERGPGLTTRYSVWIEARDRANKRVLLGGLGGMGCGSMWVAEEDKHTNYPGYSEAPEQASPEHKPPFW